MADDITSPPLPEGLPEPAEGYEYLAYEGDPHQVSVVPKLRDDAPPVVREGIARRRVQAVTGVCPCGAVYPFEPVSVSEDAGEILRYRHAVTRHMPDCPAGDAVFLPALVAWQAERWADDT